MAIAVIIAFQPRSDAAKAFDGTRAAVFMNAPKDSISQVAVPFGSSDEAVLTESERRRILPTSTVCGCAGEEFVCGIAGGHNETAIAIRSQRMAK
jgi:hypothetical protein